MTYVGIVSSLPTPARLIDQSRQPLWHKAATPLDHHRLRHQQLGLDLIVPLARCW